MTATAALAVIVGAVGTFVSAIINNPRWSPTRKRVVVMIVSTILGLVTVVLSGQLAGIPPTIVDWVGRVVVIVAVVFSASQAAYNVFYRQAKAVEQVGNR